MLQEVLPVRRAVLHLPDEADKLGVHPVDTKVNDGALPCLDDFFFDLLTHLGDHFLNACRVNATILYQLMQGKACHLTAHRVEATQHDGLGGIINDDLNPCSCFEGADITTFTTDDTALDLVALDVEDGDGVLNSRLRSQTLDGLHDDLLGLLVGGHLRLFDDLVDIALGLVLGFSTQTLDESFARLVSGESSDGLETLLLALTKELELSLLLFVLGFLDVVFLLLQLDTFAL